MQINVHYVKWKTQKINACPVVYSLDSDFFKVSQVQTKPWILN